MRKYTITENEVETLTDKEGEIKILVSPKTVQSTELIMGIADIPVGEKIKKHVHDYGEECFYVLQGEGCVELEGIRRIDFSAGSAVIIPKGIVHSIENTCNEVLKVVFATAPLAPTASIGHRNIGG
ncbi:cupin domain-containing protein [Bacillus bombysepticus]